MLCFPETRLFLDLHTLILQRNTPKITSHLMLKFSELDRNSWIRQFYHILYHCSINKAYFSTSTRTYLNGSSVQPSSHTAHWTFHILLFCICILDSFCCAGNNATSNWTRAFWIHIHTFNRSGSRNIGGILYQELRAH